MKNEVFPKIKDDQNQKGILPDLAEVGHSILL